MKLIIMFLSIIYNIIRYVKYNEKMKCIEFYSTNKIGNDLGIKDSALNIK